MRSGSRICIGRPQRRQGPPLPAITIGFRLCLFIAAVATPSYAQVERATAQAGRRRLAPPVGGSGTRERFAVFPAVHFGVEPICDNPTKDCTMSAVARGTEKLFSQVPGDAVSKLPKPTPNTRPPGSEDQHGMAEVGENDSRAFPARQIQG
jgi:hypothetical protein